MQTAERTDYASLWKPRSLDEAMFQIDTSRCFDRDEFFAEGGRIAERLAPYIPANPERILEFGCGVGRTLVHMPGQKRIGIDVSDEMRAIAAERYPGLDIRPQWDGYRLVNDGSIDFAYSWLVLQHMDFDDAWATIEMMAKALKPGGVAAILLAGYGGPWSNPGVRPDYEAEQVFDPDAKQASCPGHRMVAWQPLHVNEAGRLMFDSYHIEPLNGMSKEEAEFIKANYADLFKEDGWSPYYLLIGKKVVS